MSDSKVLVDHLVEAFIARGVKRIFGVPGGGSSLDLIRAAEAHGVPFVLARHETSAAIMALASGEIDDAPGVALTTIGPGLANAVNGMACATLDRAPLCLVSDGHAQLLTRFVTHQVFDQAALSAPVVKGHCRMEGDNPVDELEDLLDLAQSPPYGAVHVELTGTAARRTVTHVRRQPATRHRQQLPEEIHRAQELLARATRPVVIVGLEACRPLYAAAVRRFCGRLDCPVLVTYKAKGVVPDSHPRTAGVFTGGTLESACIESADLIVLVGLDPVELIPQAWRYRAPVLRVDGETRRLGDDAYGPDVCADALLAFVEQQAEMNSAQVKFDNQLVEYVDERLDRISAHYDRLLGLHGKRMEEIDERHLILQQELIQHVHDLIKRIDFVFETAEQNHLYLEGFLREVRDEAQSLADRLDRLSPSGKENR